MPFLRAARIKKNLQPEIERVKVLPTLVVEEETEPEEEFTPTQIEDLHRLIDIRTKEAEQKEPEFLQPENVIVVVPEFVPEAETIILDAESVQEIPESEDESFAPEATTESIAPESEHEHETVTPETDTEPEISQSQTELAQETSQPELSQEVTAETITPETDTEPEISQPQTESAQETSQPDSSQEVTAENLTPEFEQEISQSQTELAQETSQPELSQEVTAENLTPEFDTEPEISEAESESEAGILPEDSNNASADFDENSILDEPSQNETPNLEAEIFTETHEPEQEIITPEAETESSHEESHEQSQEDSQPAKSHKDYSGSQLNYDFTSGERYVDKVSTKTEFDKMLDELANISKELLSWQADKFARDYTEKFQEGESSQAEARKYEAFLGGYITNAAMMLYDKGYREAAIKQLEQAKSILDARKKLEDETSAIKSRVEEQNDSVDLSDILGLFGDG